MKKFEQLVQDFQESASLLTMLHKIALDYTEIHTKKITHEFEQLKRELNDKGVK